MNRDVCLSTHLQFWHAHNSVVFATIETGLARNDSCVFEDHRVQKSTEPTVIQHKRAKGKVINPLI